MNNKQTEHQINRSFNNAKPDVFDSVAADCPTRARVNRPSGVRGWKFATFALAAVLTVAIVFGAVVLGFNGKQNAVAASVTLDVNPSVSVSVNQDHRVVNVEALNNDGAIIIGNMDFKGVQLEVTINALIGSMLRNGYLSNLANSVLVSIDASQSEYDALVTAVTTEIQLKLRENEIEASVLSQWIRSSDQIGNLARQLDISLGKAQLITKILNNSAEGVYTAEQLAKLSVNDLNLLLNGMEVLPEEEDKFVQNGSASEAKFIGRDAAIEAALQAAGLTQASVQQLKCKMDNDNGTMVYEVEFVSENWEYDIDVNAVNGDIVQFEREQKYFAPDPTPDPTVDVKTEEEIRQLVFDKVGVPQDQRSQYTVRVERDYDDGEYEAELLYNGVKYELTFSLTGEMLQFSQETVQVPPSPPADPSADDKPEFKQYILQQLKSRYGEINLADTYEWDVEMADRGNIYEVEFKWRDGNGRVHEFECDVDRDTYELLRFEHDWD